jgi:hypothetical protein
MFHPNKAALSLLCFALQAADLCGTPHESHTKPEGRYVATCPPPPPPYGKSKLVLAGSYLLATSSSGAGYPVPTQIASTKF